MCEIMKACFCNYAANECSPLSAGSRPLIGMGICATVTRKEARACQWPLDAILFNMLLGRAPTGLPLAAGRGVRLKSDPIEIRLLV